MTLSEALAQAQKAASDSRQEALTDARTYRKTRSGEMAAVRPAETEAEAADLTGRFAALEPK